MAASVTLFTETCEKKNLEEVLHRDLVSEALKRKAKSSVLLGKIRAWGFPAPLSGRHLPSLALCWDQNHNYILQRLTQLTPSSISISWPN